MATTRVKKSNGGILSFLADEALIRHRVAVEGTDADHLAYPDAITERPIGMIIDGAEDAEDAVSVELFGKGETKVAKLNGTTSKGYWLTPEDPGTDATGMLREVPATNGAFWVVGRALEDGADQQEIGFDDCVPFLAGAQDMDTGILGLPGYDGDPASPIESTFWYDYANNRARMALGGGTAVTIGNILAMLAFVVSFLVLAPAVSAGDKVPVVVSNETTGTFGAAVLADNFKIPGTLEVTGVTTLTGDVDLNGGTIDGVTIGAGAAPTVTDLGTVATCDINGGTVDGAVIGGAAAAAITGTTITGTTITDGTVSLSGGTVTGTYADLGVVTTVDINGGTIDAAIIGGATPAAITGTTIEATGAVTITEGALTDNTILPADIKVPRISSVSEAVVVADFTDGGGASGYFDITPTIEINACVIGWKFEGSGAFDNDTSAVMEVGVSGDTDKFSADTAQSCFTIQDIGSCALAAESYTTTAATVRITVTGNGDFTSIKTADNGAGTLTVYYLETE